VVRFASDPGTHHAGKAVGDNHLVREIGSPTVRKHRIGPPCHGHHDPGRDASRQRKPLAWRHAARDNPDRELEVITVEIGAGREAFLPVIQVMPASLGKRGDRGV
jgi:hypothetical protein